MATIIRLVIVAAIVYGSYLLFQNSQRPDAVGDSGRSSLLALGRPQ
jgi:hypothetical protein